VERWRHVRRGVPGWVRDCDRRALHSLAGHLRREGFEHDLSPAQEWLWSAVVRELCYRRASALRGVGPWLVCSCDLCVSVVDVR
jgi:hypothetical protein